jgi:hypothetical protein
MHRPSVRPVPPVARRWSQPQLYSLALLLALVAPLTLAHAASSGMGATIVAGPAMLTPVITALNPRPGETLTAMDAHAYVAARVEASADLGRVTLRLDGRTVPTEVLGRDAAEARLFYQPRRWRVGAHCAAVRAWDVAGHVAGRVWCFTIVAAPSGASHGPLRDPAGRVGRPATRT